MTSPRSTGDAPKRLMASPLRYPGGKGSLYSRLRGLIRDSGLAGCTYVEPYAGGAGAGLGLLVTGQVEDVVINDLDPSVSAFWRALTSAPDEFIERILKVNLSVKEWRRQREVYLARDSDDLLGLGFATFYLNRTNHSGVLNAGPIGGLDQSGAYKIDARFNRSDLAERVRVLGLYADRIAVTSADGARVIKRYGKAKNTFIYADPPYFEKAGSLYLNAFGAQDHEALAKVLNARAEGSWLLTYDDVPQVHELYPDRRRRTFSLHYSAHRVMKATEIAVLSDGLADIPDGWTAPTSSPGQ
jgi:DNA adenine methylase